MSLFLVRLICVYLRVSAVNYSCFSDSRVTIYDSQPCDLHMSPAPADLSLISKHKFAYESSDCLRRTDARCRRTTADSRGLAPGAG